MSGLKILRGKAWVFGDDLDVDLEIVPYRKIKNLAHWPHLTDQEIGSFCMTQVDPNFPKKVNKGDFIVAGMNMGCGHDHATGPRAIRGCGISVVIAQSLHEWFLRNCILLGLPVIQHEQVKQKVSQGDELEVDLAAGELTNIDTSERLTFEPLPKFLLDVIEAGGVYSYLKSKVNVSDLDTYLL
jgi:3-isopropylmalate/(R)-2-methylmalate dehydratase small subunit